MNNQYVWFWTMMSCIASYILFSLLTCRRPVNLDRVLNRGQYAKETEPDAIKDEARSIWWKFLGITQEFTRTDRWLATMVIGWNFGCFGIF